MKLRSDSAPLFAAPVGSCSRLPPGVGVGFKPVHLQDILSDSGTVTFFEVHAENYMGDGGPPHAQLGAIRERYPLSVHGVGLSIGSVEPLDREHVARLKRLCHRYAPESVSEHLAWSSHAGIYLNDLLPVLYTHEALNRISEHIDQVQSEIECRILIENPAAYVLPPEGCIPEVEFLAEIVRRTGCGLLLDINNVLVSTRNQGSQPQPYLEHFPLDSVEEIHLGGHHEEVVESGDTLLIDTHGAPIAEAVWALYAATIARVGPIATLIEWDNDVPDWSTLSAEATMAHALLRDVCAAKC
jgi:uncharacterized protein